MSTIANMTETIHLTHDDWGEAFIFEGFSVDQRLGHKFVVGGWATRPPGIEHEPWDSERRTKMVEARCCNGEK